MLCHRLQCHCHNAATQWCRSSAFRIEFLLTGGARSTHGSTIFTDPDGKPGILELKQAIRM